MTEKQAGRWVEFRVRMFVPDEATVAEARDYIHDWAATGRGTHRPPGGYGPDDPGDPMWYMDPCKIKVSVVKGSIRTAAVYARRQLRSWRGGRRKS